MSETAQEYTRRILSNVEGQDPLEVQSSTNKKLTRLTKDIPLSKLRKRPEPDKWSVAEILAHLADVEIVIGWRMRSILGAPGTTVQAYDQNAWSSPDITRNAIRDKLSNCMAFCARRIWRF